jgi:hypothetical protein
LNISDIDHILYLCNECGCHFGVQFKIKRKDKCEYNKDCPGYQKKKYVCTHSRIRFACNEYHYRRAGMTCHTSTKNTENGTKEN